MTEYSLNSGGFERFLQDAEKNMAKAGQLKDRIADVTGRGDALDGRIHAEFTSTDGLARLDLDPRVLRMPSEELSQEIRAAVNAASKDFQTQLSQVTGSMFGMPTDPLSVMNDPVSDMAKLQEHAKEQASQLGDAYAGQMKDLLRELGVQQQRAKEAMERYRGPGQF